MMFGVLTVCLPLEWFQHAKPTPAKAPLISYTFKYTGNAVMRPDDGKTDPSY
jgi:hypothetical protein